MSTPVVDQNVEPHTQQLLKRLRSGEFARFVRFGLVGFSGVLVNQGIVALAYFGFFAGVTSSARAALAALLGVVVSIFTNFVLNDVWTWGDRPKRGRGHWFKRLGLYYAISSVAGLVQWGVTMGIHEALHWHILVANLFGIACGIVVNYPINNRWTFAKDVQRKELNPTSDDVPSSPAN